ncbi:GNAT family N-acetyltransferase [Kitasatospora phosalacinea]|uniref:GNAT family N-acetyltransferase n=1 Tax=Kitasatospora phosalacinea TaxID=2065 RepID=UPI0035DA5226
MHPGDGPYRVEVLRSVTELPPGLWERLAPVDDPMWSRSVFTALERSRVGPAGYAYLLLRRGGEPVAVLPLSLFPDLQLDRIVGPHERRLLAPLRRRAPRLLRVPMLLCGHLLGQGRLLAAQPPDERAGRLLVAAALDLARRERLGTVLFKDFAGPDLAPLRTPLTEAGFFLAPALPDTELALPTDSFEEYLAALPAKPRRNARAKIRRFAARPGLRTEVLAEFDHLLPQLLPLYRQVMDRADQTLDVLDHAFLAAVAADPASRLVACFDDGPQPAGSQRKLVGFLLCLFAGTGATGARIGLDYRLAHESALYHNLHYAAVRLAMANGCGHIRFAQTAYPPKTEMGCALVEQWHAMTHLRPLPRTVLRHLLPPALAAARAQALGLPDRPSDRPSGRPSDRPRDDRSPARTRPNFLATARRSEERTSRAAR